MLSHHPEIAFPGEFEIAVDQITPDGIWPALPDYYQWLKSNRHFLWHGLQIDATLDYPSLVRSFLGQMKQENEGHAKPFVGAAVHWKFQHLPRIWPGARFIHVLRDPRDVAASIVAEGWEGNHYVAARIWHECEVNWTALKSSLPDDHYIEVRFEDLARDPRKTLERLCAFIGVPYRESMLSYPDHTTYTQVDPNVAERWRRDQSRHEIRLGEAGAREMLEIRGYEPSGLPQLAIRRLYRRWLRFQSRASTLPFRLRRYGVNLWLQRRIAQALGMRAWHDRIMLRHHTILNRHLK